MGKWLPNCNLSVHKLTVIFPFHLCFALSWSWSAWRCLNTELRGHTYKLSCTQTYMHKCAHMRTHAFTHCHTHTHVHTRTLAHVHTHTHTHKHTRTNTHTHTHTRMRAQAHMQRVNCKLVMMESVCVWSGGDRAVWWPGLPDKGLDSWPVAVVRLPGCGLSPLGAGK